MTTLPIAISDAEILAVRFWLCVKLLIIVARYVIPTAKLSEEVNRKCPPVGTRRYNFQSPTPTLSAIIHFVADRRTDGQTTVSCQKPVI